MPATAMRMVLSINKREIADTVVCTPLLEFESARSIAGQSDECKVRLIALHERAEVDFGKK
jgi:hypothetical protein